MYPHRGTLLGTTMKQLTLIVVVMFAWLITSGLVEKLVDNGDGSFQVQYKQYCTEILPTYLNGDLLIKTATKEILLRVNHYAVEPVAMCVD